MVSATILFFSGVSIDTSSLKKRSIVEQLGDALRIIFAIFEIFGKSGLYSSQKLRESSGMSSELFFGFE